MYTANLLFLAEFCLPACRTDELLPALSQVRLKYKYKRCKGNQVTQLTIKTDGIKDSESSIKKM